MGLFEVNYKVSNFIKFIIISLIGLLVLFFINIYSLNKMNQNYIRQNAAIVGTIQENNPALLAKIVPIITKGKVENYEMGEKYLDRYSYNTKLNAFENPITKKTIVSSYFILAIFFLVFMSLIFIYYLRGMIKNMKCIEGLNKKAQQIVEGRFVEVDTNNFKEGIMENLNMQFNLMNSRIKGSIDALKQEKVNLKNIINDISHQFKTPIAAMTMYTDILKDVNEMEKEDVEYFLNLTTEQVRRMDWLVKTLLKYARLESDVVEYKKVKQSLNETTKECVEQFLVSANEKGVSLEFINSEDVEFYHDRKWMQEAIMNIVKNGIEHTKCGGYVKVNIEESDIFIKINIKDNGDGISKEDRPKIFERFHKGSNSVNPQSIGIGLSLSKNIIEANGGNIKVKSKEGKGSEFIITFIKR
ncbi:MAG: sensor histidine kinase [Sarcina sp.]